MREVKKIKVRRDARGRGEGSGREGKRRALNENIFNSVRMCVGGKIKVS